MRKLPLGKPHWGRTHKGDLHHWHGVGGVLMRDQLGAVKNTRVKLNYSYNLGLTEGRKYGYEHKDGLRLALGIFGDYTSYRIDKDILGKSQVSSGEKIANNRALNDITYQKLSEDAVSTFDVTMGAMFSYAETFFLGFSLSQMLQNNLSIGDASTLTRHYYVSGMVKAEVNQDLYLIPTFLTKVVRGAPASIDVSLQADWRDQWFIGGGYRHQDAITLIGGFRYKWGEKIKDFRRDKHRYLMQVYYSYDITVSKLANDNLKNRSHGSHEITIGFLLPPKFKERNAEDTWRRGNTNNLHKKKRK